MKLHIDEYIYGTNHKLDAMQKFLDMKCLSYEEMCFIGDEINDVNLLRACGLSFVVADANERAKEVADIICENNGGNGAFREAVERLLLLKGIDIERIVREL